ncbi:hypothetical protein SLS58_004178 [Diplodia intermedia]|uniref:Uncharacterized protein n=1 Tax=Diplodia intermedia TaxID=856260 RepID=A0ABR3TU53_9PEZI
MPPQTSSASGYETGGNAEEQDFYAYNRPPSPCTPELFPTPPRQKMERKAAEEKAAADAAAAEHLRQRLLAEQHTLLGSSRVRANTTLSQESSSQASSSYDIILADEVAAARRKEQEVLEAKHDADYFKRVTDQSISGFGIHAVQEGLKDLKMRTEPLAKRLEDNKWLKQKKPVGSPEELHCPCWNYPDSGWRFCIFHEDENRGRMAAEERGEGEDEADEAVVVDEDEVDDEEDGGVFVG